MRIKAAGVSLINHIREYEDTDNWTIPFGPWSIFAFVHVWFIYLRPCILSPPVSETRHSLPKKEGRLSTTRHNYARKKICGSLYPFEGIFLAAINLTKGFFDATISAENSRGIIIITAIERNFSPTWVFSEISCDAKTRYSLAFLHN